MKRGAFITNSTDVRNMFSFAMPGQVLNALNVYSTHFYGSMLWDLYGDMAGQVYRSWNTCVKLVWNLPRSTHNYFVDHLLALDFSSARKKFLGNYAGFLQRLMKSVGHEVRTLSYIVADDIRSATGKNCFNLRQEF